MIPTNPSGTHDVYYNKITGELNGILTAFSGDAGAFQVFVSPLRDYVLTTGSEQIKNVLDKPLIGRSIANFGLSLDQVMLKISQLLSEFNKKYERYR